MKQFIIIWVLALGMCSINVSAQTKRPTAKRTTTSKATQQGGQVMKFKQVAKDGYVWYKLKRGNLYGARDAEGNDIIPIKYKEVEYNCEERWGTHWFVVKSEDFSMGAYTVEGTMVISTDKHLKGLYLQCLAGPGGRIYWRFTGFSNDECVIMDARGNKIFSTKASSIGMRSSSPKDDSDVCYFSVIKVNGKEEGIYDLNGNMIVEPKYEYCSLEDNGRTLNKKINGKHVYETINYSGSTHFDFMPYEGLYYAFKAQSLSPSTISSSSSNSSSNNNESGSGSTTIVIEHPQTPQPFQEWQQCANCWGEGKVMCLGSCGGTGTYYVGDRLHICNSCGGTGKKICPICGGQGGRYITVYR